MTDSTIETPTESAVDAPQITFAELNLHPDLLAAIHALGFTQCTPIQAQSLPPALAGADIIGKAQTGTGKTAAFLVALINTLLTVAEQEERFNGEPRAVILAPTRELALQIEKDALGLVSGTPLSVLSVVGGMDYKKQKQRLNDEIIDILIGTPGRMIDFITNKDLFLSEVEFVVIDEADRMLDMGFIPDVKRILRNTPKREYRQTFLFSATFSDNIINLAQSWTNNAQRIDIQSDAVSSAQISKQCYFTTSEQKLTLLYNIITQQHFDKVIVFANRRDETRDLVETLQRLKIRTALLSGDVPQAKRIKTLENFREGRIQVLVATDVAGRGIHIDGVTHVINYTLPEDPEDYVHRIGRTGRAGTSGVSISFACEEDSFEIPQIEELLGEKLDFHHPEGNLLTPVPLPDKPTRRRPPRKR